LARSIHTWSSHCRAGLCEVVAISIPYPIIPFAESDLAIS
jgi:hypothetical protein